MSSLKVCLPYPPSLHSLECPYIVAHFTAYTGSLSCHSTRTLPFFLLFSCLDPLSHLALVVSGSKISSGTPVAIKFVRLALEGTHT